MDRLACVDLPALPLQLLLRREPSWRREAVAVVDRDDPQGRILWVNERAYRGRVRPGRRYAEALALMAGLRAGVVETEEIEAAQRAVAACARRFSPVVEQQDSERAEPGLFWLDASGFERLFPSLQHWAEGLRETLREDGWFASVVVGFDRFSTMALAKSQRAVKVLSSVEAERRAADPVRLDRLALEPRLRDALERLGVVDVAGLRALPPGGLLTRFGKEAHRLHQAVLAERGEAVSAVLEVEPVVERFECEPDDPELDLGGLLFLGKRALGRMRLELLRRGEVAAALELRLWFEKDAPRDERLQPAEPTLDEVQLIDLLRLRLEAEPWPAAPIGFELRAEPVKATAGQLELFAETPRRDLGCANQALARLRAEFGEAAVCRAVLGDGHLPEARVLWQPISRLVPAEPEQDSKLRLLRRVMARPARLNDHRPGPDGWLPVGLAAGPVRERLGPYRLSGGWWAGERSRDYYFAVTERGDLLWLFYDRCRRRWYLHGSVS